MGMRHLKGGDQERCRQGSSSRRHSCRMTAVLVKVLFPRKSETGSQDTEEEGTETITVMVSPLWACLMSSEVLPSTSTVTPSPEMPEAVKVLMTVCLTAALSLPLMVP